MCITYYFSIATIVTRKPLDLTLLMLTFRLEGDERFCNSESHATYSN
jgi:hypothetical protein